jgi:hypothetical protein
MPRSVRFQCGILQTAAENKSPVIASDNRAFIFDVLLTALQSCKYLVKHLHAPVDMLLLNDQGRQEPQHRVAREVDDKALVKAAAHDITAVKCRFHADD